MQKLMLADDVFDALLDGKYVTIRYGRRDLQLGDLLFESTDDTSRSAVVNVRIVYYSKLRDVMLVHLLNDGFKDYYDMESKMKRFYPNISLDSEVTTIVFDLI